MYNYSYNRVSTTCQICKQPHTSAHSCKILCIYCHQIHKKEDMIENICPKMLKFAREIRPSSQVTCKDCKGEGIFEKLTVTTYLQTKRKFQKRMEQFENLPENQEKEEPKRRIIKTEQISTVQKCTNCNGSGILKKVENCCIKGCQSCNFQRCFINPKWKSSKIEKLDEKSSKITRCSLCQRSIQVGGRYMRDNCKHIYHQVCFKQNNWECRCYDKQVKTLLDFIEEQQQRKEQQKQLQKQELSNIQFSLGVESDEEDYQNQLQIYSNIFKNRNQI